MPQLAIAFAVNTELMANSWVALMLVLLLEFRPVEKAARSPSPQLAPVEASVKLSSACAGGDAPISAAAIEAAPQPSAALNWRLVIPVVIEPSPCV